MTCSNCGSRMDRGDERCPCCQRKPDDTLSGEFSLPRTSGALATKLQTVERPRGVESIAVHPAEPVAGKPAAPRIAVQAWLFRDGPASNVIPLDWHSGRRAPDPGVARQQPKTETTGKPAVARRPNRTREVQEKLDFLPAMPARPRTLGTKVEASIFCDEPVATLAHRIVASVLDWSMVLIGYGLLVAFFRLFGGELVLSRLTMALFGAMLPLLGMAYGLTFAIAGAETAGMHWTRLRLTTFEGFPPDVKQRVLRFIGSCLSKGTVLGMLWVLADEESLAWQDHMSGTFPTPADLGPQVFQQ